VITVKRKVHIVRRSRGRKTLNETPPPSAAAPAGRIPRISRLMALAVHFDRLLREGKVSSLSELARLAHVSQPRMTQIMNLSNLAPDIQEELLFPPRVTSGRDPIHEKALRPIVAEIDWRRQRRHWQETHPCVKGMAGESSAQSREGLDRRE